MEDFSFAIGSSSFSFHQSLSTPGEDSDDLTDMDQSPFLRQDLIGSELKITAYCNCSNSCSDANGSLGVTSYGFPFTRSLIFSTFLSENSGMTALFSSEVGLSSSKQR